MPIVTRVRDSIEIIVRRSVQEEKEEVARGRDVIALFGVDINSPRHELQSERATAISKEGRWAGQLDLVVDDTKYFLVLKDDLAEAIDRFYKIQNGIGSFDEVVQKIEKINLMPPSFQTQLIDAVKAFNDAINKLITFVEEALSEKYPELSQEQKDLLGKIKQGSIDTEHYFPLIDKSPLLLSEKKSTIYKSLTSIYALYKKLFMPLNEQLQEQLRMLVREKVHGV